eukprot:jgi/Chrzof1/12959/Cz07g14020.t1_SDH3[v5.2]
MLRSSGKLLQLAARQTQAGTVSEALGVGSSHSQQFRFIGGDKIPEYWGRPSPYTEGTDFLGTPPNHHELVKQRPLSPDVFEIDSVIKPHYKFPWGATTSIMNRATGVALTVGATGAAYIALTGDLPGAVLAFKANYPLLVFPAKFLVAYPLVYHYLGGMRHFVWDLHKIGNQADHTSLLETERVETSSKILLASSVVLTGVAALL